MSEVLAKCAIAAQNIQFTKLAKFEFAHLCWSPVWRQSKVQDSHQRTPTSRIMIGLPTHLFFLPLVYTSFLASDLLSTVRVWEKFTMNKFRNRWSLTLGIRLRLTKLSPPTSIFSPSTGHHPGTSGTLLYRIVGKGPVVFMQHGMVGSSTAWYITTWTWLVIENQAPCWTRPWSSSLPTCGRGLRCLVGQLPRKPWEQVDKYSGLYSSCREHQIFDPDTEDEFWQFSQDEMSKYDLPSQLNYVLQFTNKKKERVYMWSYLKSSSTDFLCGSLNGHHHLHGDEFYGPNLVGKGRTGGLLGTCRLCRPHEESCQGWFVPWGLLFSKPLISALGSVLWPSPFCGGPHGVGLHFLVPP